MTPVKANDPESWLAAIWEAIDRAELTDAEGNEVNTAMAWIREALDLPEEVHT